MLNFAVLFNQTSAISDLLGILFSCDCQTWPNICILWEHFRKCRFLGLVPEDLDSVGLKQCLEICSSAIF